LVITGAAGANCRWTTDARRANRRIGVGSSTGARPEWLSSTAHITAAVRAIAGQADTATCGTEWPHEATATPLFIQVWELLNPSFKSL